MNKKRPVNFQECVIQMKVWMAENGFTQNDAAEKFSIDPSRLSKMLNGYGKPSLMLAKKIEDATGIPAGAWMPPGESDPDPDFAPPVADERMQFAVCKAVFMEGRYKAVRWQLEALLGTVESMGLSSATITASRVLLEEHDRDEERIKSAEGSRLL